MYPSSIKYDWAEIERKHRNDPIEEAKIVEQPETEKTENIRAKLFALLEEHKKRIRDAQNNAKYKKGGGGERKAGSNME